MRYVVPFFEKVAITGKVSFVAVVLVRRLISTELLVLNRFDAGVSDQPLLLEVRTNPALFREGFQSFLVGSCLTLFSGLLRDRPKKLGEASCQKTSFVSFRLFLLQNIQTIADNLGFVDELNDKTNEY